MKHKKEQLDGQTAPVWTSNKEEVDEIVIARVGYRYSCE